MVEKLLASQEVAIKTLIRNHKVTVIFKFPDYSDFSFHVFFHHIGTKTHSKHNDPEAETRDEQSADLRSKQVLIKCR